MKTIRLTAAQAMVRYLANQLNEDGVPYIAGMWAIFGHGNVAGIGEALYGIRDELPTYRGQNEQSMAHAAIAYAKQLGRRRAMAVTSSIGPGALNMVTAAALAHVNRLPVLFVPGDVFANRGPDPVLQQIEDFGDGTMSANDCFRPVSRYFDRIMRPEQLLTALPRAMRTLTDPADCGPVTLAFCQDVQAEAYNYPESFFAKKTWRFRRPEPDIVEFEAAVAALKAAKNPVIVAGGGVHFAGATDTLKAFVEKHQIPVVETQAGKSALAWDHGLNFGPVGVTGAESANVVSEKADLVISDRWSDLLTSGRTEQLQIEVFAFLNQTKSSGTATREFLTGFYYQFLQLLFRQMDHPGSEDEAFRRQITVASPEQTFSSFGALREWISNSLLLFTQSRQAAASQDTAVATVKAYIESHLSDELDRDTLAAMVYLNADYLSHLFKKDTGSSLINYIIDRRIARSKELLAKGEMSIRDIAITCGFQNISYFSRQFKKSTGMTPRQFRN